MNRILLCLVSAVGLTLLSNGCTEEQSVEPSAGEAAKPDAPQQKGATSVSLAPGPDSFRPTISGEPQEAGRATPQTQDAARRVALERFQQMRKEPVPGRPE